VAALVVLGLLTIPVQCADVDHIHSIFESPTASQDTTAAGSPANHRHADPATDHLYLEHRHQDDMLHLLLAMEAGTYDPLVAELGAGDGAEIPNSEPVGNDFDRNDVPSLPRVEELLISPMVGGLSALLVLAVIVLATTRGEPILFPAAQRLTGWIGSILAPPPRRGAPGSVASTMAHEAVSAISTPD
jgi:hypothetical protein